MKKGISNNYTDLLKPILSKRTGGAVNITGIYYQVMYACLTILKEFSNESQTVISLEGIEDVDVSKLQLTGNETEFIQLKSSKNKLNANALWELGVLQNYLEVYAKEPRSKFKLVYNMSVTEGNLKDLVEGNLKDQSKEYWLNKFSSLSYENIDYLLFLKSVSFEFVSINDITLQIKELLFEEWEVNIGTEEQFLKALFYYTLICSKERKTIVREDVSILFQEIVDSFSKAPINEALKNDWIKQVSFSNDTKDYSNYYDGKAALPIHVAQKLPVRRIPWEKKIETLLKDADVTIIKSSSGQGKSTLAWQVCYNLKSTYDIYQVQHCHDFNAANTILEFIQSRLKIGQLPLVVFDGLNSSISGWNYVVEGATGFPVKFIITTRNEDWYRYGSDVSKSNTQLIDINLSREEAKLVHDQLQKKGKVNSDDGWQTVWEKVQESGLLIEYTYLLTKGEMIQDRLKYQIADLNKTKGATAKLEILRLISLADSMNVKIRTKMLVKHIAESVGFEYDRGEVLRELSNEYFINFDDVYIAGLHPVRSNHLVEILHENLPIDDSLISLFTLLDDVYFSDYFMNAPLYLNSNNKKEFYNNQGAVLSTCSFKQMVLALDGVLHIEPQIYWEKNRQIYDEASQYGGMEIFATSTIPFINHSILQELADTLKDIGNSFLKLSQLANQLPKFSIDKTDVYLLASSIQRNLKKRNLEIDTYLGFGDLTKWFKALNLSLEINPVLLSEIEIKRFFDKIESFNIDEAQEIATFYLVNTKNEYLQYLSRGRSKLISYLKKSTDSLTIVEKKGQVHINYLLYGDDVSKANEQSVQRIQTIFAFLPIYEKYCTEAIMLPFPS